MAAGVFAAQAASQGCLAVLQPPPEGEGAVAGKSAKIAKARMRLLAAAEAAKKVLSGINSTATTLEELLDGHDVTLKLSREELEAAAEEAGLIAALLAYTRTRKSTTFQRVSRAGLLSRSRIESLSRIAAQPAGGRAGSSHGDRRRGARRGCGADLRRGRFSRCARTVRRRGASAVRFGRGGQPLGGGGSAEGGGRRRRGRGAARAERG